MRLWGLSHKTSSMNVDDEPTGGSDGLLLRQVGELLGKQEMEEVEKEGEEREKEGQGKGAGGRNKRRKRKGGEGG